MNPLRASLLFILLFLNSFFSYSENKTLNEEKWQELTRELNYEEVEKDDAKRTFNWPSLNIGLDDAVVKYAFFFIVLSVLIFFLIRYLWRLESNAKPNEEIKVAVNSIQEAELNPMDADLSGLIESLTKDKKYRELTRAHFLLVLQKLNSQKFIVWQNQKTNFDFVKEVSQENFHDNFRLITATFERIWYGFQSIGEEEYNHYSAGITQLINELSEEKK